MLGRRSILGSHLNFGAEERGWDFVSPGHGDVDFETFFRALNRIGYTGPLSIEWEDSGMDREWGAQDSLAYVRRTDFAPSDVAFDALMTVNCKLALAVPLQEGVILAFSGFPALPMSNPLTIPLGPIAVNFGPRASCHETYMSALG